jgi:hypothetical protein
MSEFDEEMEAYRDELPDYVDEKWRYGMTIRGRSTGESIRSDGYMKQEGAPQGHIPDVNDLTGIIVKDLVHKVQSANPDLLPVTIDPATGEGISDLPVGEIRAILFVDSSMYATVGHKTIQHDLATWPLQFDVDVFAVTEWENYEAVFGGTPTAGANMDAVRERKESIAEEHWASWLVNHRENAEGPS